MDELNKKRVLRKIIKAKSALILDEPFFGSLVYRLDIVPDMPGIPTFGTDGKILAYNSEFADSLTFDETIGVLCHEILHVANGHPWRRDGRDKEDFNIACDFAIDPLVEAAKKTLPKGKHINPAWLGKSAEWIYGEVHREKQPGGKVPPDLHGPGADGAGCGFGEVMDDTSADAQSNQADWQVAVVQAASIARAAGKLPAGLERLIDQITHPKIDWKAALRRFVQRHARHDYSWRRPNRRYLTQGIYLPSVMSETIPPMAYGWDMSGSRDYAEARAECMAELVAMFYETCPEKLYVLSHDTKVYEPVGEYEPGDYIEDFKPQGGGGTDFRCLFQYVEDNGLEIACMIIVTDLMGTFPDQEPGYPVLWVSTTDLAAPFGEVIRL